VTPDLFPEPVATSADLTPADPVPLAPGACLLPRFAAGGALALIELIRRITAIAPFRHMRTPGGFRMSVAISNCGALGWISDRRGYRYEGVDPERDRSWPPLPPEFCELAAAAASYAGFDGFAADACLINRYEAGARMSMHQDKNERDFTQPIVSVSLGLPAVFLFGGESRGDRAIRLRVSHGDVVVWGGPARLKFHGVLPLKAGQHAATGPHRFNLTFRKAG
jgi:alkylated DNA repair protein (DNA oxidative demethylase)